MQQDAGPWEALGRGSFVLRSSAARALVNIGLVVGSERALVIDTGCGPRHAAEILTAVRAVTTLPLVVANTHAHWDHFFGNAVFRAEGATRDGAKYNSSKHDGGPDFWAHAAAARAMAETAESQRVFVDGPEPEMAAGDGVGTEIVAPTHLLGSEGSAGVAQTGTPVVLDLGGISVELFTLGRGHTDGDLMVGAPGVLFTGDVVEEGAEPSFEDSHPAEWIAVLRRLAGMGAQYPVMIPGHGRPVDAAFAAAMADTMERGGPHRHPR
ncbi:MBL fold metallo-hydrolase [Arthrobacter sp. H35-D1]|uniref:MBL fold metallo-hydrolase n=1 Tax=Arthrobacter sp. H35-D1 TaxID=3046202 RepID=UPI0024BADA10|nr:MBL fold metallo-hydrolase [Arthrobacter sp. H35-D1]MDJ0312772.1 MBL fold metallo-hydrolase [Arthrobacter sp. H35-D1]